MKRQRRPQPGASAPGLRKTRAQQLRAPRKAQCQGRSASATASATITKASDRPIATIASGARLMPA